jgi:hypothetical protein
VCRDMKTMDACGVADWAVVVVDEEQAISVGAQL